MRVRTASDVVYTAIAWFPLLAVAVGVAWILATGVLNLEIRSFGTEYFVDNSATTNLPEGTGPSDEQLLMDALSSGDTAQMEQALDQVDARRSTRAGASG